MTSKTASVQDRASARSRPRSTARRTRTPTAAPTPRTRWRQLEHMLVTACAAEHVAAIVFEPQQGEGGFIPAPPEFVEGCADLRPHGIVLVADEVQTGFGRTGRMFAMEHFGVEPDLIVVAKSIAAGLPLSGVIGRGATHGRGARGRGRRHVHRQPGRPRSRARRARRLRRGGPRRPRACGSARRSGRGCSPGRSATPQIGDVRGLGAMLAIELVRDPVAEGAGARAGRAP